MGKYKDLVYTISHPIPKKYNIKSRDRMSAAADGIFMALKAVGKLGLSKEATVEGKVVLVVVQLKQWALKDNNGHQMQMVHFAFIGAIADSRHFAYTIYKQMENKPALKPSPPKGWMFGEKLFLWFEDPETQQKEAKHDVGNLYWESVE